MEKRKVGRYIEYRCPACGKWFEAKSRSYKPTCSDECARRRLVDSISSMVGHTGAYYEKWLAAMKRAKKQKGDE